MIRPLHPSSGRNSARRGVQTAMGKTEEVGEKTVSGTEVAKISVCLKDIVAILEDAVANRRAFLEDFHDENITMSRDLFEVLVAYQRYHPLRKTA